SHFSPSPAVCAVTILGACNGHTGGEHDTCSWYFGEFQSNGRSHHGTLREVLGQWEPGYTLITAYLKPSNTFCEINANDAKLSNHGIRSSGAMVSIRFSTIVALYSRSVEGRVHFIRAQVNPRIATMQEGLATLNTEQIYEEFAVVDTPD